MDGESSFGHWLPSDWLRRHHFCRIKRPLISLLGSVVTAVGLWGMRSWAMACYASYVVVLIAEEVLGTLSSGFGWKEVVLRAVFGIVLLCTVGVALRCAFRKATQPDALADG